MIRKIFLFFFIICLINTLGHPISAKEPYYRPDGTVSKTVTTTTDHEGKESVSESVTVNYTNRYTEYEARRKRAIEEMVGYSDDYMAKLASEDIFEYGKCPTFYRALESETPSLSYLETLANVCARDAASRDRDMVNILKAEPYPVEITKEVVLQEYLRLHPGASIDPIIRKVILGQMSSYEGTKLLEQ